VVGLGTYSEGSNVEDSRLKGDDQNLKAISKSRSLIRHGGSYTTNQHETLGGMAALLDDFRNRQATDPRDKVFALLNVAHDTKDSDLRADYRKPFVEVYATTVKWLLKEKRSLFFLAMVEKKHKPDLVSWVPDFRFKDYMNFLHTPSQIYRGRDHVYRASGSTKAPIGQVGESDLQLTVYGIHVGTIVARTDPPGNFERNVAIGARVPDDGQWHTFARATPTCQDGTYPPTGEPIDLAWHRTRIWDILPGEGLRRLARTAPPSPSDIAQLGHVSYNEAADALLRGSRDNVAMMVLRATTRKRMFRTDTGLLGIGHRSLQVGDEVYVLMGADMPCVLRPLGGNFSFGGEAYVHGIMDGEMLVKEREGRAAVRPEDGLELAWTRQLGEKPWSFDTKELVLF